MILGARSDAPDPTPPRGAPARPASRVSLMVLPFLAERRAQFIANRSRLSRCVTIASLLYVVVFVALVVLAPFRGLDQVRVEMPPESRTIVLEPPVAEPPAAEMPKMVAPEQVAVHEAAELPQGIVPEPIVVPTPHNKQAEVAPKVDPDAGRVGRERARAATAQLAHATSALDKALGDLSSSLGQSTGAYEPSRHARRPGVAGGRSDGSLGGAETRGAASGVAADLGKSAVQGSLVAVGTLSAPKSDADAGVESAGAGTGAAPGVYRSNASLLAVIQRYAAGIQYCYDNDLKRHPNLSGKLVVAITVAAAGDVEEVSVVQNSLGSERVSACALSQIRGWKFPGIPTGVTTFQVPFVFSPPN
ncbi:MAG TPA: AgmX/PglI C-terminal domain-containing protein [Candidatus Saccharimonadaceae bacterium]|jgi:TonB family protein|nr:AgmX/PglI C-terminal domain-containing protein [Candidatus Saccharimonadaceae bacterium]